MKTDAKLTKREAEIAELAAWGMCKKDIARSLFLSLDTVNNHFRNIYAKIGCTKVNELSAWWFCTHFHIPMSMSPIRRKVAALCLLAIFAVSFFDNSNNLQFARIQGRMVRTTRVVRRGEDNI